MTSQQGASSQSQSSSDAPNPSSDNITPSSPRQAQPENESVPSNKDAEQKIPESVAAPNPRLQALATKKATLEATLASLQAQKSALVAEAKLPSGLAMPDKWSDEEKAKSALSTANGVIKEHIALLHRYNEIKDIGQGLMGIIAETRGVRVAAVMEDYGMGEKD